MMLLLRMLIVVFLNTFVLLVQENLTKDDAREHFLRILRTLPYGSSVFFSVRKIDDPIGLLPGRIILGINKRGVSLEQLLFGVDRVVDALRICDYHCGFLHELNLTIHCPGSFFPSSSKRISTLCRVERYHAIRKQQHCCIFQNESCWSLAYFSI